MLTPFTTVLCVFLVVAGILGVAWMLREPRLERQLLREMVEDARAEMERTFAKALAEAAGIAEAVKRHRARIEGAKGGRPANEPEQPQRSLFDLSAAEVAQLPVEQQLAWANARRGRVQ